MAIYGKFSSPSEYNKRKRINGKLISVFYLGIFSSISKGIDQSSLISSSISKFFFEYFDKCSFVGDAVIIYDYVYLSNYNKNQLKSISNKIIELYEKDRNQQSANLGALSDSEKNFIEIMIGSRFIQNLVPHDRGMIDPRNTTGYITYHIGNKLIPSKYTPSLLTEFNETLNFIYFYFNRRKKNIKTNFYDFLVRLLDIDGYGAQLLSGEDFKAIKTSSGTVKEFLSKKLKPLITYLATQYNKDKQINAKTWITSAQLTNSVINNSNIFDKNASYQFFSENSNEYQIIFQKIKDIVSRNNKIFDLYFRALNVNKYFISDYLLVKQGSQCISDIEESINILNQKTSLHNLSNTFQIMDNYFLKKEFIPVSLKKINPPDKFVKKFEYKSNLIRIINPPKSLIENNVFGTNFDEFDMFLIEILNNKKDFNSFLNKKIIIDYKTFKYGLSDEKISFAFDLKLEKKSKRYIFSTGTNGVKIRYEKTSSATGEGTINSYSLNYVMKVIYSGMFNASLQTIVDNRMKDMPSANSGENILKKYKFLMSKREIITSSSKDSKKIFLSSNIFSNLNTNEKLSCANHLKAYYEKLTKKSFPDFKKVKEGQVLGNILNEICGKELGFILDKESSFKLKIDKEMVKIDIPEETKIKLIMSEWALITGRGPIEFNGKKFGNVSELKDLTKYQIKFPALVKIGI